MSKAAIDRLHRVIKLPLLLVNLFDLSISSPAFVGLTINSQAATCHSDKGSSDCLPKHQQTNQ